MELEEKKKKINDLPGLFGRVKYVKARRTFPNSGPPTKRNAYKNWGAAHRDIFARPHSLAIENFSFPGELLR